MIRTNISGFHRALSFSIGMLIVCGLLAGSPAISVAQSSNQEQSKRRIALVVGNARYDDKNIESLKNPGNDAKALAEVLERIGFEVLTGTDLTYIEFSRLVDRFLERAKSADVTLIFYSGHGFQFKQKNHLVPIDFAWPKPGEKLADPRTINLSALVDSLERVSSTRLLFLDACRNDPSRGGPGIGQFAPSLSGGIKAINSGLQERGLIPLLDEGYKEFTGSIGTFIAFATAPGKTAIDGIGQNSPFVTSLLRHIETPGQRLEDLILKVRIDVTQEARKLKMDQTPWSNSSLSKIFFFVPPMDQAKIRREMQSALKRMQCYAGGVDGVWGSGSRRALTSFNIEMKSNLDVSNPGQAALNTVMQHLNQGRRCSRVASLPPESRPGRSTSSRSRPAQARSNKPSNRRAGRKLKKNGSYSSTVKRTDGSGAVITTSNTSPFE